MITKKLIKGFVREKLATNKAWALRGLVVIYGEQTSTEKGYGDTHELNGVGFTGVDGEFLSSLAEQYHKRGRLSKKQMGYVYKKMPKYWKQLVAKLDYEKLFDIMVRAEVVTSEDVDKYIKKLKGKAFMETL